VATFTVGNDELAYEDPTPQIEGNVMVQEFVCVRCDPLAASSTKGERQPFGRLTMVSSSRSSPSTGETSRL
jgi:hypothetical protein